MRHYIARAGSVYWLRRYQLLLPCKEGEESKRHAHDDESVQDVEDDV